jgi:hypothetical protein
MPFFRPGLPPRDPVGEILHPWEEFDKVFARIRRFNQTLDKVVDPDDQRVIVVLYGE